MCQNWTRKYLHTVVAVQEVVVAVVVVVSRTKFSKHTGNYLYDLLKMVLGLSIVHLHPFVVAPRLSSNLFSLDA